MSNISRADMILSLLRQHGEMTIEEMLEHLPPTTTRRRVADTLSALMAKTPLHPQGRVIRPTRILLPCPDGQRRLRSVYRLQEPFRALQAQAGGEWQSEQQRRYVGQSASVWQYAQRVAG